MSLDIDNTTLTLLGVLAALLVYHRFFSTPTPLVHPLLLGKQSDVSAVRKRNETGVYRSFATGQGSPFTVRPVSGLKTVRDIAHTPKASGGPQRCILDVPLDDGALAEILHLLPAGLRSLFPTLTDATSIITLLPPSTSTVFPLLLLQLGAASPLVVLPAPRFLTAALSASARHPEPGLVVVHASLLDEAVEQVFEDRETSTGILVVGDPGKQHADVARAAEAKGLVVKFWEDIWEAAELAPKLDLPEPVYSDVHSYFYSGSPDGTITTKVSHINITAGIAGLLSIFPADKRPSAGLRDVVASSIPLDTPFGMTIALGSIFSGSGFRFIGSAEPIWPSDEHPHDPFAELAALTSAASQEPKPTVLFISRTHHEALVKTLNHSFRAHPLGSFAARYKLIGIQGGELSRTGRFEKLVWRSIRKAGLGGLAGDQLRSVVVVDHAPPASILALSHLLLSLPISRIRSSPFAAGPIFASHYYDLQCRVDEAAIANPSWTGKQAHVGPPASNVEVLLKGEGIEKQLEEQEDLSGAVWARGPSVLEVAGKESKDGWTDLRLSASVQTNGAFVCEDSA